MNGTTQSAHGVVQYNSWCSTFKGSMNRLWKKKHVDAVLSKTIFKCSDQKKKINKSDINRIERKKKIIECVRVLRCWVRVAALGVGRDGDLCRRSGACGDTDRTIKCAAAPSGGGSGGGLF